MAIVSMRRGFLRNATGHASADLAEVDAYVAHMRGVKKAVGDEGRAIQARAKADLASHRDTGASSIEFERQDTDALISLVDVAALSIEYGREAGETASGKHIGRMQGLHILGRATGL